MLSLRFVLANLAFAAIVSAQETGVCPVPFELTSTQGAIYGAANGVQIPASSYANILPTKFQLTAEGYLITATGHNCSFIPWLRCGNQTLTKFETVALRQYGTFELAQWANGSVFWACSPEGLHNSYIPESATLYQTAASSTTSFESLASTVPEVSSAIATGTGSSSTSEITAAPGPVVISTMISPPVVPEYYLVPDYLLTDSYKTNGMCRAVGLQASRCFSDNSTTTSAGPISTYTANSADKRLDDLHRIGTVGGFMALLAAYLL